MFENRIVVLCLLCFMPAVGCANECRPHIEEHADLIQFRPHDNAFLDCPVSEAKFVATIATWSEKRSTSSTELESIFLGRAIHYPWLSTLIARASLDDEHWNHRTGTVESGHINEFVGRLLSNQDVLSRLSVAFADSQYTVAHASVEKVLVGSAADALQDPNLDGVLVPYDALVWFTLKATN